MSEETQTQSNKCVICGDRAKYYNFNVLSCDSCKAFFRRNATKDTVLWNCIFDGNCEISKQSGRLCRFCRLKKCFAYGMKKEWILSDEERRVRKSIKTSNDQFYSKPKVGRKSKTINFNKNLFYFSNDANNDSNESLFDAMEYSPLSEELTDNELTLKSPDICSNASLSDSETDLGSVFEFALTPVPKPITDYRNNFTEMESNYLTELLNATKVLKTPFGTIESEATNLFDAYYVLATARHYNVLRFVSMSKNLRAFDDICQSDRFALLGPALSEMLFVRVVVGYFIDNDEDYLAIPTDSERSSTCLINLDLFRRNTPSLYEAQIDFYRQISREWDSDEIILDLLTAIVLFNPNLIKVKNPSVVRLQQHIYKYLLQRYLLLKYRTESEAKAKYSRLMNTIEYLHVLFNKNRQIVSEEYFTDRGRWLTPLNTLDI